MSPRAKDPGMAAFSDEQPPPPEPEPDGPIDPTDPSEPRDQLAADEVRPDQLEEDGPIFDIEAFVKALPEGARLCPICLGAGAAIDEPPYDPTTHPCPTCKGWGELQLPSHAGGQARRRCADCAGLGWKPNAPGEPNALPAGPEHFYPAEPPVDVDGHTPDDPDFDWSRVVVSPAATEPETAAEPPVPTI